jgi:hypothetical protein
MKKFILLLALTLTLSCCNKDDNPPADPLSQLPPATQTGAGTFGCLVNGVPYVDNSGDFNCFYQLVGGEYYFGLGSTKTFGSIEQIAILSYMKNIDININIPLQNRVNGNFFSEISFDCICPNAVTTSEIDGFVNFSKFTTTPNIVSGTFEFNVTDPNTGIVYNITNGRFDSQFTQ